jgi:hypothetical protein
VAAIPDAGGAQRAPRGMMRALFRVVVLGGLVVAAWLLGSGTGHADEDPGQPDTGLIRLVGAASSEGAAPSDGESGGRLGVPPTVESTLRRVLSAAPAPRLSVQPPVKVGILKPIVNAVRVPRLPTPVLAPVSRSLSAPTQHGAALRSQAPAEKTATVAPATPAVRAAAATTPVLITVGHAPPTVPACAAAHPVAAPVAGPSVIDSDPVAPVPVSPPGSTTSPCLISSSGGGASTKSAPDLAVNNSWATAAPAPMPRLLYLGASDLPRSLAPQPSTSPD